MTGAALRTQGLGKAWGGFHALAGVDLTLPAGARHALIGPNGAGKTTLSSTSSPARTGPARGRSTWGRSGSPRSRRTPAPAAGSPAPSR